MAAGGHHSCMLQRKPQVDIDLHGKLTLRPPLTIPHQPRARDTTQHNSTSLQPHSAQPHKPATPLSTTPRACNPTQHNPTSPHQPRTMLHVFSCLAPKCFSQDNKRQRGREHEPLSVSRGFGTAPTKTAPHHWHDAGPHSPTPLAWRRPKQSHTIGMAPTKTVPPLARRRPYTAPYLWCGRSAGPRLVGRRCSKRRLCRAPLRPLLWPPLLLLLLQQHTPHLRLNGPRRRLGLPDARLELRQLRFDVHEVRHVAAAAADDDMQPGAACTAAVVGGRRSRQRCRRRRRRRRCLSVKARALRRGPAQQLAGRSRAQRRRRRRRLPGLLAQRTDLRVHALQAGLHVFRQPCLSTLRRQRERLGLIHPRMARRGGMLHRPICPPSVLFLLSQPPLKHRLQPLLKPPFEPLLQPTLERRLQPPLEPLLQPHVVVVRARLRGVGRRTRVRHAALQLLHTHVLLPRICCIARTRRLRGRHARAQRLSLRCDGCKRGAALRGRALQQRRQLVHLHAR
eukprot:347628-Chlamydomonas_euryale.AAC.2